MRALLPALLLLSACVGAGHGGDDGAPVGQAARARHGADPMAVPPPDAGNAEDPAQRSDPDGGSVAPAGPRPLA